MVGEPGWLKAVQGVITDYDITHIFPAHDDALLALAENADQLTAKVVTSPMETCCLARSKLATLRRFESVVPTPRVFTTPQVVSRFPVFLKPDRGQGSQRTDRANDLEELMFLLGRDADRIILEFLPGAEFTVDCFSDREHGLLYAAGRVRRRMRQGIAMDSAFVDDVRFADYASRINTELKFHGAWFFQVKEDSQGVLKLMELAPRIAGTSALSRAHGVNLPLLSLYEADRIPVHVRIEDYHVEIDRALITRYRHDCGFENVYVDLDDTLVVRGKVNADLVRILFQFLNSGRRLILITRHAGDLEATLQQYHLGGIFHECIHLRSGESKADYIQSPSSIVIDDSFSERMDISRRCHIPVFDAGSFEVLADDRI